MQVNRGFAFWGVALITAGAVALAIQAELIAAESARQAWRLWPVVLVVIGLSIIASRTPFALVATLAAGLVAGGLAGTVVAGVDGGFSLGCGGEATETVADAGTFEGDAEVVLDFNCGELAVSTAAGTDWSVEARHGGDREPQINADGDSLRVSAEGGGFIGFSEGRQEWDVVLPTQTRLDLTVDANASSSDLDLADAVLTNLAVDANAGDMYLGLAGARVAELAIDANAGSLSIVVDDATSLAGTVEMNAGSLELCAPEEAVVAITIEDANVTFTHNLDDLGLSRRGDTWSTGNGAADITLDVEGNAASFTLNPEGGCE
jgi:Domain of unknown function (DUF5668)/Putative adhesin